MFKKNESADGSHVAGSHVDGSHVERSHVVIKLK